MNLITHGLVGWAVANISDKIERRDRALITVAGILPDLDGLGIIVDKLAAAAGRPTSLYGEYHHLLGHNVGMAFLLMVSGLLWARRKAFGIAMMLVSFHLHLLGDLVGSRGPDGEQWAVPYLLPFLDSPQITWRGQWALNSWQNILTTVLLLALTLYLAWRRGYSPLEMISLKADRAFVLTLRNRFPNQG